MPQELPVHINRDELHSLEVPQSFEADGPFDIRLVNHGQPLHVHLHLDDPLSERAEIEAVNHYVEGERLVRVNATTDGLEDRVYRGKLKIASGYGSTTRWINVELSAPDEKNHSMNIDESLAKPQPKEPEPEPLVRPEVPVLVLGVLALLVAVTSVVFIDSTIVFVGSVVVLGGVLLALFFLLTDREPSLS